MKNFIRIGTLVLVVWAIWFYAKRRQTPQVKPEKVLMTAANSQIQCLDPAWTSSGYEIREIAKVYEGLLDYHYLKRPLELIPNLAESMPTISADQLVYTFQILKGVKFQDNPCFPDGKGRELTAHDFVYTFKRLADPKFGARSFWVIDGRIQGLNEWRERYADAATVDYSEEVPGLKATDRYTLQITLNNPYPQFLYILTLSPCYVVPHEAVQYYGAEFLNHPVGTGPFTIEAFNPQATQLVYYKNPHFRDKRFPSEAADEYKHMLVYAGKQLPLVDKLITYILPEEQPKWLKFQKGQLDAVVISRDNVALEVFQDNTLIPTLKKKEIQLFKEPELGTRMVVFNNAHPLFKNNLKLRQAMSMAFDGQRYNELFHKGAAIPAQSIVPPGLVGYRADYINPYRVYNVEKAKQYLAEAGYPGGKGLPEITLDVASGTIDKQRGEFFQKYMKEIGINIKVVSNIFPELIKKVENKGTMLHVISWLAGYPDAENFYQLLYGTIQSHNIGAHFDDPAFNALFEKAIVMPDSPERTIIYEQLNRIAAEKVPIIYLVHQPTIVLYQGWVKNCMYRDCIRGVEQYFDVNLDEKKTLLPKF